MSSTNNNVARAEALLAGYRTPRATASKEKLERGSLLTLCKYAGVERRSQLLILSRIGLLAGVSMSAWLLTWHKIVLLCIPLALILERWQLQRKIFKRAQSFEVDFTALLLSLSSAVRTGLDPLVALSNSAELFYSGSAIHREIETFRQSLEAGCSEKEAIEAFGSSISHPDIQLFRTAFLLARREGSSLAESLQRLAKVSRQRQSFRRKVRAAVAMQKLSTFGIVACTLIIGVIQYVSNPSAFSKALADPLGVRALEVGSSFIILGLTWMLTITRAKI